MTSDIRIFEIETMISTVISDMIRNDEIIKNRVAGFSSMDVVQKMKDMYYNSLNSDREKYLLSLIKKLAEIYNVCVDTQNQYQIIKKPTDADIKKFDENNKILKGEIAELEKKINSLELEITNKETNFRSQLTKKQKKLQLLINFVEKFQSTQSNLSRNVENIRGLISRFSGGQKKIITQTRIKCVDELDKVLERNIKAVRNSHSKKLKKLDEKIHKEKSELHRLQNITQNILDDIYSIEPDIDFDKRIMADELPNKTEEIRRFLQNAINNRRKLAVQKMRKQIEAIIPDIDVRKGNVVDIVCKSLEERVKQKELECQKIMKKAEEREKFLKQKLEEQLNHVKQIQRSQNAKLDILNDVEKEKAIWEENKRKLDAKMSALSLVDPN